jgi:shikimate kinase
VRRHITLNGFMGAGKTTIGKKLARRLGVRFFDLDALVVDDRGPIEAIFEHHGTAAFRTFELEALTKVIREQLPAVIALGGGAVTYAPTLDLVKEKTYSIWLYLTVEETIERVRNAKRVRPLLGPNPNPSKIASLYTERLPVYRQSDLTVRAGGKTSAQVVDAILERLPKQLL